MYHLKFIAFNGISFTRAENLDRSEVREMVAGRLRRARLLGKEVNVVEKGREWEIMWPDSGVGDDEGWLKIIHETFECRECGQKWDTKDRRNYCCSLQELEDMEREDAAYQQQ